MLYIAILILIIAALIVIPLLAGRVTRRYLARRKAARA